MFFFLNLPSCKYHWKCGIIENNVSNITYHNQSSISLIRQKWSVKLTETVKRSFSLSILYWFADDIGGTGGTDIEVVITTLGLTDTFCHASAKSTHNKFQAINWKNYHWYYPIIT